MTAKPANLGKLELGTFVWFMYKQARCVGVVRRYVASRKLYVIEHNGKLFKGPRDKITASTVRADNEPANVWGLDGYRRNSRVGTNGAAFTATITFNGKAVLRVRNAGDNHGNVYVTMPNAPTSILSAFVAHARNANAGEPKGADNFWFDYMRNRTGPSQSPEQYRADHQLLISEMLDIRRYDAEIAARVGSGA